MVGIRYNAALVNGGTLFFVFNDFRITILSGYIHPEQSHEPQPHISTQ